MKAAAPASIGKAKPIALAYQRIRRVLDQVNEASARNLVKAWLTAFSLYREKCQLADSTGYTRERGRSSNRGWVGISENENEEDKPSKVKQKGEMKTERGVRGEAQEGHL